MPKRPWIWGGGRTSVVEGEWKILPRVSFSSGAGDLRRGAFDHSKLFQSQKTSF